MTTTHAQPTAQPHQFPLLLSPLEIGSMTVSHRIVMAPHGVVFAGGYDGGVERVIDYHIERAKGGVGMMVMSNFVEPASWRELASWGGNLKITPPGNLDLASNADMMPAYRRLIDDVQSFGNRFISQLNCTGRQTHVPGALNFGIALVAPSALPCAKIREAPREMTTANIAEFVQAYADSAANMLAAGTDGVEVFAAQGYLLSEFLLPKANLRSDSYGGSLDKRMSFLLGIISAIRTGVGREFAVGVRLNGDDYKTGGVDLPSSTQIAGHLQATNLVDYLNISSMTASTFPGWIGDISAPQAQFADQAEKIRASVPSMRICVVSRIDTAGQGEAILQAGQADLVGVARALISHLELPNKARAGRSEEVRRCIYSNQSCVMGLERGRGVGCVHNVAVGREAQLGIGTMRPAARKKTMAFIGGGPAGTVAARIAVERGQEVTLFEKSARLGGQNLMTAAVTSRRGMHEVTRWQELMLRKGSATLRLETDVDADALLAMNFDAIKLATGSVLQRDTYSSFMAAGETLSGTGPGHVFTTWDVFSTPQAIGHSVVVIEDEPNFAGIAGSEYLAASGGEVHIISPHVRCGASRHINYLPDLFRRFSKYDVRMSPNTVAVHIEADQVVCCDRHALKSWSARGVDSAVLAAANKANDSLCRAMHGGHADQHAIGDCVSPSQLDHAIGDGGRVGWML